MVTNFKQVQAQPFSLSGSGAVAGATSVILKSFAQIDGTLLTMTDFGSIGYGTIEPGNGTLEEQISFTGVSQNANGTATLTGVKTVLMVSPYTETSGLAQTHAGSTTFVLSNTSGYYNQFVAKNDDATITGQYTFDADEYPQVDNAATLPTQQAEFATKAYVDSIAIAGAPNATTAVQGLVQLPTQAQVDAGTATGGTGASLTPTPALLRSKLLSDYVADTGAADAYVITPAPAITALTAGQRFSFKVANTNTGTSTIAVNGLTGTIIYKDNAKTLRAGDLVAGMVVEVEYNGINGFQLMTPAVKDSVPDQYGSANKFLQTNGTTASWGYPYDYQVFTSGTSNWTKPSDLVGTEMVLVQAWGGGGAGGGTGAVSRGGGGGGGGAYVEMKFRASDLTSTVSVTVAAAVTGGAGTGSDGNNTTFGSYLTAYGGGGGEGGAATCGGGGGGGGLGKGSPGSSGAGATGGQPRAVATAGAGSSLGGGNGGTAGSADAGASGWGGGGGGGGRNGTGSLGGSSMFGGGGGGGGGTTSTTGGTSLYGGAGGAGSTGAGGSGTAPGGGGAGAGTAGNANGGDGARGEVRVWVFK